MTKRNSTKSRLASRFFSAFAVLAIACAVLALTACAPAESAPAEGEASTDIGRAQAPTDVSVMSMTGPTSIGLLDLMEKAENGETVDTYQFDIVGTADEITGKVVSGDVDIALVPANVASVLYNKTEGAISVIDINTLSVLYLVTGDPAITSFDDIAGKTVYLTGKGTTPEYVTRYLIEQKELSNVQLEFKSEAQELAATLAADPTAIAIMPQPFATAAMAKNAELKSVVNLGDVWKEVAPEGSELVTGVTIVQNDFAKEHPDAVTRFLEGQTASVQAVLADPAAFSQMVVDKGIIASAPVAEKAIGQCSLTCISGEDMKSALEGYLDVLSSFDAASIGGELPDASFYYGVS